MPIWVYTLVMARLPTSSDAFNAVAEPRRRQILGVLVRGEMSVNDIAGSLRINQPQVSKHLRVLRKVGLVRVRKSRQQRLYTLNSQGLKGIHDWVSTFDRLWSESFDRLDEYLTELQHEERRD